MSEFRRRGRIKCVVWDLDDTLWEGTLLEDQDVVPKPEMLAALRTLDARGILNSVASRNDPATATAQLRGAGVADLLLYPQIGWGAKSAAVSRIAEEIDIGLDAIAFVDDQPFECAEVAYALPAVLCIDATEIASAVANWPEFHPRFATIESRNRRHLYRSEAHRRAAEADFTGTDVEFLATLGMTLTIHAADIEDLRRAEELTVRTHQLNSTGRPYSHEELDTLRRATDHLLLVASLTDRFGDYGIIGLALVQQAPGAWRLKLLLTSCRVAARGIGTVLLGHVLELARDAGAGMRGDFVDNGRNRTMYLTYKLAGFDEISRTGDTAVLAWRSDAVQPPPNYLTVRAD